MKTSSKSIPYFSVYLFCFYFYLFDFVCIYYIYKYTCICIKLISYRKLFKLIERQIYLNKVLG